MLPSMRYQTKKLAELYHKKKSFHDHRSSIQKIKHKERKSPISRSNHLNQLRDRMHSAFNYTQMVKSREIRKDNLRLYEKCFRGKNERKSSMSIIQKESFQNEEMRGNTSQNSMNKNQQKSIDSGRRELLLRNHRSSPINKLTGYERSRENLRLAVKISDPCPAINTKKLEKIHEEARRRKERIMMYESSNLKSSRYLDKRLAENTSKDSLNMTSRTPRNSYDKTSLFREKVKFQNHTFYMRNH